MPCAELNRKAQRLRVDCMAGTSTPQQEAGSSPQPKTTLKTDREWFEGSRKTRRNVNEVPLQAFHVLQRFCSGCEAAAAWQLLRPDLPRQRVRPSDCLKVANLASLAMRTGP